MLNIDPLWLHHPIGLLLSGGTTVVWVSVELPLLLSPGANLPSGCYLRATWLKNCSPTGLVSYGCLNLQPMTPDRAECELKLEAPRESGDYTIEVEVLDESGARVGNDSLLLEVSVSSHTAARSALMSDVRPLSYAWGTDRGLPAHRYYLEKFLEEHATDVQGRCLEFQNPAYAYRLGAGKMTDLDILNIDDSSPHATLIGDLTKPNSIPSNRFDCIICTHVLHMIFDLERAVHDLHRILKPKGVLLVGVPHVSICDPGIGELWRFTEEGLRTLLTRCFPGGRVEVRGFGNSLVAAGDLRGMTFNEFLDRELESYDPWCPAEICGRAVKSAV